MGTEPLHRVDLFPASAPTTVFAHQGGWDEILLVAAPLLVIVALLVLANKRVGDRLRERADTTNDS